MSTKLQKYKKTTKQVRVDIELHRQLKFDAVSKNTLMSSLLNLIIKNYFDKLNGDPKEYENHSK